MGIVVHLAAADGATFDLTIPSPPLTIPAPRAAAAGRFLLPTVTGLITWPSDGPAQAAARMNLPAVTHL